MEIQAVLEGKRDYMELLLLADEQEDMVLRYLDRGEMFLLRDPEVVGQCVVTREEEGVYEIKSISVLPQAQGRGYGRALLGFVEDHYADRCRLLLVGTGDSPLTMPFYLKCGFREHHRIPDFFTHNYDHPIAEAGVLLRDMVVLCKEL